MERSQVVISHIKNEEDSLQARPAELDQGHISHLCELISVVLSVIKNRINNLCTVMIVKD